MVRHVHAVHLPEIDFCCLGWFMAYALHVQRRNMCVAIKLEPIRNFHFCCQRTKQTQPVTERKQKKIIMKKACETVREVE